MKQLRQFTSTTILQVAGGALGIIGLAFVVMRLLEVGREIGDLFLSTNLIWVCVVVSLLYGAANIFLAHGWRHLLQHLGTEVSASTAIRIYSLSALGKYVPGNIFQFVGRQALCVSAGISNSIAARSTFWELLLLAVGATLFIPLAGPEAGAYIASFTSIGELAELAAMAWATLSIAGFFAACLMAYRLSINVLKAFISYTVFLTLSGVCFLVIVSGVTSSIPATTEAGSIIAAYIAAWLVGLLTPGAPAGLGVREATLALLLAPFLATPVVLMAVLLSRLATVLGDVIFFSAGHFCSRIKSELNKNPEQGKPANAESLS